MSQSSRGINAENSSWKENMCAGGLANRGYKFNYESCYSNNYYFDNFWDNKKYKVI
jgi:hypothetical protein